MKNQWLKSSMNTKRTGLILNKQELSNIRDIAYNCPDVEFLYLRENEFDTFDPYNKLENLKMLDLSLNSLKSCDFLWGGPVPDDMRDLQMPALRHLYLTGNCIKSLHGFVGLNELETLALSSNQIESFEGLGALPNLRVLSLNFNKIKNFKHYPCLPSLHSLNLVGNTIDPDKSKYPEEHAHFRRMAIAVSYPSLMKIDGVPITDEERKSTEAYRGKIVFCMMEGFVPPLADDATVEDEAEYFLLDMQIKKTEQDKPLRLWSIYLEPGRRRPHAPGHGPSGYPGPHPPMEGQPVTLHVCLQDMRDYSKRKTEIFHSQYIYPVAFKVVGDANEVSVFGSMNHWTEPIPLERIEENGKVFFQTNLYLSPGTYEYRYNVDKVEKIADEKQTTSTYGKGNCNFTCVRSNAFPNAEDEDQDTILHIRWLRNNKFNGFNLIQDENSLTYTPTAEDVGCYLRAEVLSYLDSDFSYIVYDITCPIQPAHPTCTRLEIEGNAEEGGRLTVSADYMGGIEQDSEIEWVRVHPGDEPDVVVETGTWQYTCTEEDIGCTIKVTYTPVREDGVRGEPVTKETAVIVAAPPRIADPQFVGQLVVGQEVTVEYTFLGGTEEGSRFQWSRHDPATDTYLPIPGETHQSYKLRKEDAGKQLMVAVTPVNNEGIEGVTEELFTEVIEAR